MDQAWEQAALSPLVLYIGVGVVCSLALMNGLARLMGPWGEFLEKRRTIRQRSEDARIRDLSGQVDHLSRRVDDLEEDDQAQIQLITAHAAWDYLVMEALINAGIQVPKPPPLRPPLQREGTR